MTYERDKGNASLIERAVRAGFAACLLFLASVAAPSADVELRTATLENGMKVIFHQDTTSETTIVKLLVRGGRQAEPAGKDGLSFLTTRLAVEISDQDKARDLLSMASEIDVTSQGDFSLITLRCLSSKLEATLKIVDRLIMNPLFSGFRIDSVKNFMRHRGRLEEDDSVTAGHLACLRAFFPSPGYGGSIYGEDETLKAIKGKDIQEFYRHHFTAGNIVLAISSDRSEKELTPLVNRFLSGLAKGERVAVRELVVRSPAEKTIVIQRDTRQSYVAVAYPLPPVSARGYALGCLLESLLGKGPGSRLWTLRADEQLAYNVNCRATQMVFGGVLEAYLETEVSKVEKARAELKAVLKALAGTGIDGRELEMEKQACRANFFRENETKERRLNTLAAFEALGLGVEYFPRFAAEIEAIELDEMNAYIRQILDDEKACEILVGPQPVPGGAPR